MITKYNEDVSIERYTYYQKFPLLKLDVDCKDCVVHVWSDFAYMLYDRWVKAFCNSQEERATHTHVLAALRKFQLNVIRGRVRVCTGSYLSGTGIIDSFPLINYNIPSTSADNEPKPCTTIQLYLFHNVRYVSGILYMTVEHGSFMGATILGHLDGKENVDYNYGGNIISKNTVIDKYMGGPHNQSVVRIYQAGPTYKFKEVIHDDQSVN